MSSDDRRYNPKQEAQDEFVARATEAGMDDGLPRKCCAKCLEFEDDGWCGWHHEYRALVDRCAAFEDKSSQQ